MLRVPNGDHNTTSVQCGAQFFVVFRDFLLKAVPGEEERVAAMHAASGERGHAQKETVDSAS